MRKFLSAVAIFFCCGAVIPAQVVGTGAYPFASFDNRGFDSINIGNLNTRFNIPIVNKAGRGLSFNYSIQNEGLIWSPVTNAATSTVTWTPDPSWGFTGLLNGTAFSGYLTNTYTQRTCGTGTGPRSNHPSQYWNFNYVYHDPYGAAHKLNYSAMGPCSDGSSDFTSSGNGAAVDGSGYTLISNGTKLRMKNGTTITPAYSATASGSSTSQVDSNGNTISYNGSNTFLDTTGSTALTLSGSGPVTFTYPVIKQSSGAPTASANLYYKQYTVRTNFGCSGIVEYGSNLVNLVDHITLADGSTYSFTYEGTQGATDGAVTARIASITLPTGGAIKYSRYGGTNGIVCPDGTTPGLNRTTTNGAATNTRMYQRAGTASATAYTTMVQDEKGNQTYYHFSVDANGDYEATHQQVYQGTIGGTPLMEALTCYNGSSGSCDGQAITPPITEADTTTSYNGGSQVLVKNSYDTSGNLLNSAVFNGSNLLTQTTNAYNGNSETLSSKTTDVGGNTVALATYGYDETTPTATSGLPQHVATTGTRGNQTSAHVSIDGTTTNLLTTTTAYYDTGMPVSTTAPGGFTTSFGYDPTQTFTTSTTLPTPSSGVSLSTSATYDTNSGAALTVTGMNSGQTTTFSQYDPLLRPAVVNLPIAGANTTATYTPNQVIVQSAVNASQSTNQVTTYDSYGRQNRTATWNGSTFYITDICYDSTGAVLSVGAPYTSTTLPSSQNCASGDSYTYDALGRILTASHGDGSSNTWTYTSRAVKQADSTGVTRITQQDLLGRMTGVCEISSNASMPGSGSPAACGMDMSGTGFVTGYAYNMASHTVTVTQGVQTRIFQTDAAGRSTLTQEPERGQTTYGYAYNPTGLAVTRTRPRANQTNPSVSTQTVTQYDSIGRPVSVTYSDGTPTKNFYYDQSAPCCTLSTMGASKGQLTTFNTAGMHSRSYAYDIMGRPSQFVECLPDQCSQPSYYVWRSFTYDYLGELLTDQYATVGGNASPATITYAYNLAGQIASVSGGQNDSTLTPRMYTVGSMQPFGPTSAQFGNQLNSTRQYDTIGNISGTWLCNGSTQAACAGGTEIYGSTRHTVAGQLLSSNDTATIRNSNFTYDEFGRLKSVAPADGGNAFTSSPTYDRWGNLWAENNANGANGPVRNPSWSIDPATNHITGYTYDAAGNRLNDATSTYTYDAEGNMISVSGGATATFVYDALNERVKVTANGVTERYGFDLSGRRSTTWLDGTNTLKLTQYYAGGVQVAYWLGSDSHIHFEQQDGLGTERNRTTYNGSPDGSWNDLPWGDYLGWPGNNSNTLHFALLDHDLTATSGIEHAKFREYSANEGRWFSPDPYNGSYSANNPQSLNRYTYALNNPLSATDTSGLDDEGGYDCWTSYAGCDDGGGGGGGADDGGGSGRTCIANCGGTDPTGGNDSPPPSPDPPSPPTITSDPIITSIWPGGTGSGTGGSGTGGAPNSGTTTCTGPATVSAVGTGPHQAPYTGHTGSLYPPIAGGAMGTVAVQNNFLGIGRAGLRQYGTQIFVSFADNGAIVASGGPAGPYTVSDRGDINIQNAPSVRFDLYRWDSTHNALQFGIQPFTGTVTFPNASGGACPAGWTVHK